MRPPDQISTEQHQQQPAVLNFSLASLTDCPQTIVIVIASPPVVLAENIARPFPSVSRLLLSLVSDSLDRYMTSTLLG